MNRLISNISLISGVSVSDCVIIFLPSNLFPEIIINATFGLCVDHCGFLLHLNLCCVMLQSCVSKV